MAFDQSTRNRLQKFVNDARNLLTEEFTRQLQATYGLDPKAGAIAEVDSLTQLDNRQRQTANVLRDTLTHYLATIHGKGEKDRTKQALSRIVREQAFTVLNRLAALRMAEARGFLLETIAKGYNAKGFQLYKQLAGSALGETGEAYRNYLYSVFDEFSLDLAVLFDRHSAQGRLFPRESALLELLGLINHHEIEPLWAEDETIGWIYQYFNSQEERKKMRAESQAPRNSRELAVRNQFFTPRYVVEFLTDNTLGRIWYEMTQGNTQLVESCRYLVRRPTEIFLKPGELAPEQAEVADALSQEELLKQPVYITHRYIKDPRCIRMLDPACGSMHFGLYAFDLYERIYEEAWQLEAELGAEAFVREGDLKSLHQSYDSFEDYRAEIPRLIIEHNIHGVDIDPRAVQIAGLSLWQRAQRAWQQQGIKPQQRLVVRKSNIVCAEPMPGEKALLQEFSISLNPPVLGQLLEAVFDKMELAGEAGTLLKIEEEIQSSIHEAKDQWKAQSGSNSVGDMFQAELDQATPQKKLGFDLSGVDDETFWDGAEQQILDALSNYADKAESNADQKRLFAEDAAKGFAFIDLCRKRFDVTLMNPPFGTMPNRANDYARTAYPLGYIDFYTAFIDRALLVLNSNGYMGAITSRTNFVLSSFQKWREERFLNSTRLTNVLDLGAGVLDNAMVETAAYTISKSQDIESAVIIDARDGEKKSDILDLSVDDHSKQVLIPFSIIKTLPNTTITYSDIDEFVSSIGYKTLENYGVLAGGCKTDDDARFVRAFWEVDPKEIGKTEESSWCFFSKGGEYALFYSSIHLLVDWRKEGGYLGDYLYDKRPRNGYLWGPKSWTFNVMGQPGLFWSRKSQKGISFRALPKNCVSSDKTCYLLPTDEQDRLAILSALNSKFFTNLVRSFSTGYGSYEKGTVGQIPLPLIENERLKKLSMVCYQAVRNIYSLFENDIFYVSVLRFFQGDFESSLNNLGRFISENIDSYSVALSEIDSIVPSSSLDDDSRNTFLQELASDFSYDQIVSELFGLVFTRWEKLGNYQVSDREPEPFKPLPHGQERLLDIANGPEIFPEDMSSGFDIVSLIKDEFFQNTKIQYDDIDFQLTEALGISSVRDYLRKASGFFDDHLRRYSKSKRYAPIYWSLQTQSGSYTLWVYYHRINGQTLYTCVNDFVQPKLEQVVSELNTLRTTQDRSSQDEKELEKLSDLSSELRDFRDELLRLAELWKPNLNDGVQITAAPLWKLFQHKAWQKKLKETWEKLEKGDYDWAHLACSIWPERVLRKCHEDRSLAIAHDVEGTFWNEVEVPVKRGKKATGETKLEWQPKELTDAELDALIQAKIKEMRA